MEGKSSRVPESHKSSLVVLGGELQEKIRPVAQHLERPVVFFPATRLWSLLAILLQYKMLILSHSQLVERSNLNNIGFKSLDVVTYTEL